MEERDSLESRALIRVLYRLTKENFSLSDDTILDKIYVEIEREVWGPTGNDLLEELLLEFGDWMDCVLKLWNNNTLCSGVKVLSVRLLGLIGSKSEGFPTIELILPEIEKLMSRPEVKNDFSLMVPLLHNLGLLLNYEQGFNWVLETGIWRHAVNAFYEDSSIFINRSGVKFISLLLSKLGNNYKQCVEILNCVCKPLFDSCVLTVKPLQSLEECGFSLMKKNTKCELSAKKIIMTKELARAVKYICDVLEELSSSGSDLPVTFLCNITIIDSNLKNCASPQDYQSLLQLLVTLELTNACWTDKSNRGDPQRKDCTPCPLTSFDYMISQVTSSLMSLGHFKNLMDFCIFSLGQINRFRISVLHTYNCPECLTCRKLEATFVCKLKMFLKLYLTWVSTIICNVECSGEIECSEDVSCNNFDEASINKFREIRLSETLSFQYFQLGIVATTRSLDFIYYSGSRKAISLVVMHIFDTMKNHFLSTTVTAAMNKSLLLLITLASKLEDYSEKCINKELFSTVMWILEQEYDDPRITIQTLQLLKKLLEKQPIHDLMDLPNKKILTCLGINLPSIATSLKESLEFESSWEIRDSALEVYQSIVGFEDLIPGLFSEIFNKNLYSLVMAAAADKDEMHFVKASAFKFLSKAVRAKLFLNTPSSSDLSDLAVKTLLDKRQMPECRMAACDLLAAMYVTDLLTDQGTQEKIFEALFFVSMNEFDWRIKNATLGFWQCTIIKRLADEKIPIDPSFLCFYKHMTQEDVVLKIIRIMDALSNIGCFEVLWSDVIDEIEISVSEKACSVIDNILNLDRRWKFIDKVINSFSMEVDEEDLTNKKLKPKDFFIKICQKDWREKLEGRKIWIKDTCDDLPSLMDLISNLATMGDWECNLIDCY